MFAGGRRVVIRVLGKAKKADAKQKKEKEKERKVLGVKSKLCFHAAPHE